MAKNSVENLKRIAKFLKVTPGTICINNEKVNNANLFQFPFKKPNLNQVTNFIEMFLLIEF